MASTELQPAAYPTRTPEIPIPDYENYKFDSKETPEFMAKVRATLDLSEITSERRNSFHQPHAAPSVVGSATKDALTFLFNIKTEWLLSLLYDQTLDVYEGEKIIGTYNVSISRVRNDIRQCIFHVTCRYATETGGSKIEEVHDGIVTDKLETICQKRTYTETGTTVSIDDRSFVERQPNGDYAVTVLNGKNEKVTTWLNVYKKEETEGFVSECAHVLLCRLFASDEVVPENFDVLALDCFGHFRKVQYRKLKPLMMTFRPYKLDCFGFTHEAPSGPQQKTNIVEEYFLNRKLIHRKERDGETVIKTNTIPVWNPTHFVKPTEVQAPPSETMDDNWLIQMRRAETQSLFKKKFANTMAKYPQLTQPLREMTHLVLTVRPDDVFAFVTQSFRNWQDIYAEPELLNSNDMVLSSEHMERQPEPQAGVYQFLRSLGVNKNE